MNKNIIHVWTFPSSSGKKTYETLKYTDGTTSCNCMGWTQRCAGGQRSCRHTRMVDQGIAHNECIAHTDYQGIGGLEVKPPLRSLPDSKLIKLPARKSPTTKTIIPKRKVLWR